MPAKRWELLRGLKGEMNETVLPAIVMFGKVKRCHGYVTTFCSSGYPHDVTLCFEFDPNFDFVFYLNSTRY